MKIYKISNATQTDLHLFSETVIVGVAYAKSGHKYYIITDEAQKEEATSVGYQLLDLDNLEAVYNRNMQPLKFLKYWHDCIGIIPQGANLDIKVVEIK